MSKQDPVVLAVALAALVASTAFAETAREAYAQGDAAYEAKAWSACAGSYARAAGLSTGGFARGAAYNAACCHALAGDADAAFAQITAAVEAGFRDAKLLRADADLASLHGDARWEEAAARVEEAERAYFARINGELLEIFREDQADRRPAEGEEIDWNVVGPRDDARRARVLEILEAGEMKEAEDFYHAAMVMQHGEELEDYRRAQEWAEQAAEMGLRSGLWLAAAAEDRWLMNQDKPQKYGTQYRKVDGRWTLWEVDPSVTDEERAKRDVPPLHEAEARARAWSAETDEAAGAP